MAYLSGTGQRTDRGQIILIAAFILAISFVVLAVVVNSAIFTENLSTRDEVAGSHDALENRAEVEASLERLIETANHNHSLDNSDAEESVNNINEHLAYDQSSLGRLIDVEHVSTEEGTRIGQDNASRNFTNNESETDWTVASDVESTRNFVFNITDSDSIATFSVLANDTTDPNTEWRMNVNGDITDTITVEIVIESGLLGIVSNEECTRDVNGDFTIDITSATVSGEPCHALYRLQDSGAPLWFGADIDEYDIEFEGGDNVRGTYSLVVDGETSNPQFGEPTEFPYVQENIIYSMTVNYAYYTPVVGYETHVEAAPGELPP